MDWSTLVGANGSIDWTAFVFVVGVNLLLTAAAYLLVPIIIALSKKKYDTKKIKRITIINCIVVWVLFRIIQISLGDDASAGAAVFLWGAIGHGILKKHCLERKQPIPKSPPSTSEQTDPIHVCLSSQDDKPFVGRSSFDVYGSDIKCEQDTKSPNITSPSHTAQPSSYVPNNKPITKYCSRCGHAIDPVSKKCTGCGKQYFKGFATKITLYILLAISLVSITLLFASNIKLRENTEISSTATDTPQTNSTTPNNASSFLEKKAWEQAAKVEEEYGPSAYGGTTWLNGQINKKDEDTGSQVTEQNSPSKMLKNGQIGLFVYTIDHEFTANYIYEKCKSSITDAKDLGIDPEKAIANIMDEHGGEFHIVDSGDFVDEIDGWCFSSDRNVGDLAIIENPYGYSVCYISCIGEH